MNYGPAACRAGEEPRAPAAPQERRAKEDPPAAALESRMSQSSILFAQNAKRMEQGTAFCLSALFVCLVPFLDEGENLFGVALWRNLREDM